MTGVDVKLPFAMTGFCLFHFAAVRRTWLTWPSITRRAATQAGYQASALCMAPLSVTNEQTVDRLS